MAVVTRSPPALDSRINLRDFEIAAEECLKPKTFAYYYSAADDASTRDYNHSIYSLVRFRPRVLVDVTEADTNTSILGYKCKMPFFIAPAAMGRLAHKDGELCLVRGAARTGIHYGISTHASVSHKDLAEAATPDQVLFFQLYMHIDRPQSAKALNQARELGYKAVIVTVDTPFPGKRELDLRTSLDAEAVDLAAPGMKVGAKESAIAVSSQTIDASLNWEDLKWVKETSKLPIIIKGIQSVEDVELAVKYGAAGVMISNHGGRQQNTANTPLETLLEIRKYNPSLLNQIEIYLDGGIRRGTDIAIALCLGAKAVSLGRPFMFSLLYGTEGVERMANVLGDELKRAMRLLGARSIAELRPELVNTRQVERLLYDAPKL